MNMMNPFQAMFQRAQQMMQSFQNPQQMIQRFFPDAPQEIRNDPEQFLGWLQQTGRYTSEQIQWAKQMVGR